MSLSVCLPGARADATLPGSSLLTDIWVAAIASQDWVTGYFSFNSQDLVYEDRYSFQSATNEWCHLFEREVVYGGEEKWMAKHIK